MMEGVHITNTISDEVMSRLQACVDKATKSGASGAKIHYRQSEDVSANYEGGRLKSAESRQSISYQIEVLAGGRIGRSSGNELNDLDDMLERAVALAKVGSAAHFDAYPAPMPYHEVKAYSQSTAELLMETLIENCRIINDKLKSYDPDLFIMAQGFRGTFLHAMVTSGGVGYRDASTHWSLGSYVQRTEGTDMLFSGAGRAWRELNSFFDPDYIVDRILWDLHNSKKVTTPPVGELPVFVRPDEFGMFLWALMNGVNGRNVVKGDSPLKGRLGERILDPSLTLIDDPHLDYDNGVCPLDDNGIPTKVMTIFKEGMLENFLYDLDSAGLAGAEPTGHNGCSPHSLTVLPGNTPSDELLAGIEDGLYIKGLVGFGQSNIMNGDFSSNVSLGYRVKDGKVVGRVKDTMVSGNIYKMLESGVRLSSDVDPMCRVPYAVIPGVHVSAK